MESDSPYSSNKLGTFPQSQSQSLRLIVCLGRSCRKYSSDQVFSNFKAHLPSNIELISAMCLGQCGNGPMVVVEPDQVWYCQVHPDEVDQVIQQHLINKILVQVMLYAKFHQ